MNAAQSLLAATWMHSDFGWGWMALMVVVMVLFWGAVIFGIVWLIRDVADRRPEPRTESPVDVLDRRFAEGEISEEDRNRRQVLSGGGEPVGAA